MTVGQEPRKPAPEQREFEDHPVDIEAEDVTTRQGPLKRWMTAAGLITVLILISVFAAGRMPAEGEHLGFWSLAPALSTLVLVFFTREVISSLFIGIVVGGIVSGDLNLIQSFLIPSIGSESYAVILLVYLWALGGLIGMWTRTGGALAFAEWAGRGIVRGPRSARFFAWLMGVVFHQGGTISTILAGTTVRPVTDKYNISKEELTYIVDSTASPVATVIPFNAWPLYVAGLVAGTTPLFMTTESAIAFFFSSIAVNFYGIFAITMTLLFALGWLPWVGGKMQRAIDRSRSTGALNAPGAKPLTADELTELHVPASYRTGIADFLVPMGTLLIVAIVPYVLARLAGAPAEVYIAEAFGLAVLVAFGLAIAKGMELQEAMDGFVDGCKGVTIGAIILGLALTLGEVSGALGTAAYMIEATSDIIIPVLLPAILMAICMAIAFSTGTSWGTYAVVFPVAMPLAYAVNPDPFFISLCFGAVLGGSTFGDQCSPISDTTILSALACGGDLMDHVTTQLPLALVAATLGGIASTLLAMTVV
ncbi:MAG TPA: Na+/H+ antiporter NhaC family protein [Longimicrobiaceae bacterium]|nr:Na+/H+ antiporter NhaC family protein [Longimicrobiaceae bacterium]